MRAYIEYLPGFLRLFKDYEGIGRAVDPEIDLLLALQLQMERNRIILEADTATIRRWERLLRVIPGAGDDLELRRFRIAARLSSRLPYTERQMHASLQTLVGADGYTANLDIGQELLTVRIALGRKALLSEVVHMLDEMVPLNIVIDVSVMYNTHAVLSPFTHAQLSTKTHDQLRNEVINNG
ncbi:YmfQ family protein [Christensenellaceae bacterium OttesenSCG-928-M15]|nr:YmfQ family protein [Christensenellaceae bacterium OttesenSCG-928-M15]